MEAAPPGSAPLWLELRDLAATLARQAGELAQARRAEGLVVSSKTSSTDLVTDADKAVETFLVEALARLRPGDRVRAEEGAWTAGDDGRPPSSPADDGDEPVCWVIDPIDGTINFLLGQPQYAVSIAARVSTTVVAGAVFNPCSGELFHAVLGGGAFLTPADRAGGDIRLSGDIRLGGPRAIPLAEAVVATGFSYDRGWRGHQGRVVAELLPRVGNLRRAGSAALDLCAVAAGRVDLYYECPLNEWDYAAGLLIAREAGARASGLRGRDPGDWMVAVGHEGNASDFFALLTRLDADLPR